MGKDNDYIDKTLIEFKKSLPTLPVNTIAKGGALKELSKYDNGSWKTGDAVANFEKGSTCRRDVGGIVDALSSMITSTAALVTVSIVDSLDPNPASVVCPPVVGDIFFG